MDTIMQEIKAAIDGISLPALPGDHVLGRPVFDTVDGAGVFTHDFGVRQINYREPDEDDEDDSDDDYEEESDNDTDDIGERLYNELAQIAAVSRHMIGSNKFDKHIHKLDAVPPMSKPVGMITEPHDFQLKGAAQLHMLSHSRWKGGMLGDKMGVGKTLQAILLERLIDQEGGVFGPVLIIVPAALIKQWEQAIKRQYETAYQPSVLVLTDPSVTAMEILNGQYNFIVCSYEFVERRYRDKCTLAEAIAAYKDLRASPKQIKFLKQTRRRPVSALHSAIWEDLNMPFANVILDESGKAAKIKGAIHKAVKALHRRATVLMSGTLCSNVWQDIFGQLDFLDGHPFKSRAHFIRTFAQKSYLHSGHSRNPSGQQIKTLQKFLQAMVVARPAQLLNLEAMKVQEIQVTLDADADKEVWTYWTKFEQARGLHAARKSTVSKSKSKSKGKKKGDKALDGAFLANIVRGLLVTMNPVLVDKRFKTKLVQNYMDEWDGDEEDAEAEDEELGDKAKRGVWLNHVESLDDGQLYSPRIHAVLEIYQRCKADYPNEMILIFSQFLKFLDLIAEALKRKFGVEPQRFDGTKTLEQRDTILAEFLRGETTRPMLITMTAGGTGLNLQSASIVIQTEIWWNENLQDQCYARVQRRGQEKEVKIFRLTARDSPIEAYIKKTQANKTLVVDSVMGALIKHHTEKTDIPKVGMGPLLDREIEIDELMDMARKAQGETLELDVEAEDDSDDGSDDLLPDRPVNEFSAEAMDA